MRKTNLLIIAAFICICIAFIPATQAQPAPASNGHFITANGLKLYYEESGQGTPLLLLHGFGRTASDWNYGNVTKELSKHYRVIAIDLPGHGRSDYMDTTNVYMHKKAAEYILAALDAIHIDSVYVVGHSSGAFITLYLATLRPGFVKKIVVMSGQLYYSKQTRNFITATADPGRNTENNNEMIKMHGRQKGMLLANQFWNFRQLYGDPSFTPDVLATITAKTFIIHGDNDPIAPVSNAWEMFQNISNAHLWVVPNVGHLPHIGPDNEKDFLKQVSLFLDGAWDK